MILIASAIQFVACDTDSTIAGTPVSGPIDTNTTWTKPMSPVWVDGNLTVSENVSLQVEAGVEVLFNGPYVLLVNGRLVLKGTAAEPVSFSSNQSTPLMRDWMGIRIEFLGHLEADFVNVSYAITGVLLDSSNNSVRNCTFYQNSQGISQHSIRGFAQLRDNFFLRNRRGISFLTSSNNSIVRNTFVENEQGDISIPFDSRDNIVRLNDIRSGGGTGISLSGGKGNAILDNRIENSSGYGIYVSHSADGTIAGNWIASSRIFGLAMFSSKNFTVRNNTFQTDSFEIKGDYFEHYDHTIDTTNTLDGSPLRYYFDIQNQTISNVQAGDLTIAWSNNITLVDSTVRNGDGISIHYCNDSKLSNVSTANGIQGLKLYRSLRNTISNSSMFGTYDGLELVESHFNAIDGNILEENEYLGMRISNSDDNTISRNDVVAFTGRRGILISASTNNTIKENLIRETEERGLLFGFCSGNTIYHNAFIRNAISASANWGPNTFDNGYPSGGNFWDDYNGNDTMSGPDQNLTGSDGIGDEPYVVRSDNVDRYPLMAPPLPLPSEPPNSVTADLSGRGSENVTVNWSLSKDDGSGIRNVVGYRIQYGEDYSASGAGYMLLGEVAAGTQGYGHTGAGEGDPRSLFYRVCAVSNFNESFCSIQQAGKFTRPLSPGPNLVSAPLVQSNESIELVLQTVEYDNAWTYDPSIQAWRMHTNQKHYLASGEGNHTMGIWVNATEECNLTLAGIVPAQTSVQLYAGWNLVSFPSFNTTYTVADLKAETGATRVEGYELAPPYFLRVLTDGEALQAGSGYWVKVDAPVVWIVGNG